MGARPLGRKIDELIKVPLSKKILFEQLSDCHVKAEWLDDKKRGCRVVLTSKPKSNAISAEIDMNGVVVVNDDPES